MGDNVRGDLFFSSLASNEAILNPLGILFFPHALLIVWVRGFTYWNLARLSLFVSCARCSCPPFTSYIYL